MRKKIGDLTFNEILKICHGQDCDDCPLKNIMVCVCEIAWKEEQLDQEIEVEEIENNICNTCRLNNQCPINHKPSLQCPYNDYEKKEV